MNDIESYIVDSISKAVHDEYENCTVRDQQPLHPATYPLVTVAQTNSNVYQNARTLDQFEMYTQTNIEVNVYANNIAGGKALAKAISEIVDRTMKDVGFIRTVMQPTPTVDRSVFRYTMRFSGVVDYGHIKNTTITHLVYQR